MEKQRTTGQKMRVMNYEYFILSQFEFWCFFSVHAVTIIFGNVSCSVGLTSGFGILIYTSHKAPK
jgi:hypothetical protein